MVKLSFYLNLYCSWLKWQNLNFTSKFKTLRAIFFRPEFYHDDFSRRAGDFILKLVTRSKILVAMVTKVVATWRVDKLHPQLSSIISVKKHPCQ